MNINEKPVHVAIIPDGNRRWAKAEGLEPWDGHDKGAQQIEEIVKRGRDLGVRYMSIWGSSVENMKKRSLRERKALVGVYERYFHKLINSQDIIDDEVQINIIGRWREQLPQSLVRVLEDGIEKTKHHKKHYLNFFLSYSGDDEMESAIAKIAEKYSNAKDITRDVIKESLMTRDLPAVDYLIRTGGEPHLSAGFMMWDVANAQLFFSEKMFPSFGADDFEGAIEEYVRRTRRLGG